jgi:hypothetical protein
MTLERQHGKIVFVCDRCSDELDTETDDFDEARQTLVHDGWVTRKEGSEWHHYCPDCR